jgi:CheY-like chemotaxis protein/HPt (histidine-containing phosphotransfer) domain-containing protein
MGKMCNIFKNKENFKMIDIERLLDISGLKIKGKIEEMGGDELNNYVQLLNSFTENYSAQEEKIKTALENMDYDALSKHLTDIQDILAEIHAKKMVKECANLINELGSTAHIKIETSIRFFLSSLSMLSIDIQMAVKPIDMSDDPPSEIHRKPVPRKKRRILAVDDTALFLSMLKNYFQGTLYKLTCVTSGKEALKYLEYNDVELFLLDIEMPDMDGYELLETLREKGHYEPAIFLTGKAKKEYLAKATDAGVTDFIVKPINKQMLISRIRKYI